MTDCALALTEDEIAIVDAILGHYLSQSAKVWVFGSRARNYRVHRGSDLDLAIDAGARLSLSLEGQMDEDFTESLLPYKVDIVDIHAISPGFRASIEPDFRPFPRAGRLSSSPTISQRHSAQPETP